MIWDKGEVGTYFIQAVEIGSNPRNKTVKKTVLVQGKGQGCGDISL